MYPLKNVYPAGSVAEALKLHKEHPEAVYIAGGSDILVALWDGKLEDAELISIHDIPELKGIRIMEDGTLWIGPLTCFTDINESEVMANTAYILGEAAGEVGGPQVRNIGTIGGNICNGVTSADTASTMLAYDAILEITGHKGVRTMAARDFYIKAKKVALEPGDILTAIMIPKASYEGYFGQYIKFSTRRAMDIATLGVSVNLKLSEDERVLEDIRIAFGVAGPVHQRMTETEEKFKGCEITDALPGKIGEEVLNEIHPRSSWRATAQFRIELARELTNRAAARGISQALGTKRNGAASGISRTLDAKRDVTASGISQALGTKRDGAALGISRTLDAKRDAAAPEITGGEEAHE